MLAVFLTTEDIQQVENWQQRKIWNERLLLYSKSSST